MLDGFSPVYAVNIPSHVMKHEFLLTDMIILAIIPDNFQFSVKCGLVEMHLEESRKSG
jgi:hypothetical protein